MGKYEISKNPPTLSTSFIYPQLKKKLRACLWLVFLIDNSWIIVFNFVSYEVSKQTS